MTSNTSSFISETLRQLDELNAETYLSAADQRYNQAERLEMMADAATNQADKAALLAAARGLYGKMDKLQARADTKDHQWRDPAPSQLDELSPETYWSAADKRRQQAVGLWQLDKDMGNRLPDKDKINAAEVIAAKKSNKLAAKGNDTGRARRAQDEQNRLPTGRLSPATLAAMRVDTDRASKARKVDQARAMGAYDEQNRLNKAGLNPAWRAATDAEARARRDQDVQNATLQKLGLDHKHSALPRKAGLGSAPPPRRQDESKVFRIYRNSDQSATVVMESGVAVWLAPKSVNKVLSESGNINRTKLHRLLESRIWK